MAQQHESSIPENESCREAVDRLLHRHGWSLLDPETWAARARRRMAEAPDTRPSDSAFWAYSEALYRACSGVEGTARQNLAYGELSRFLYEIAYLRCREWAQDATQLGILKVYRSFDRCTDPGYFVKFAMYRLLDAIKAIRRSEERQSSSHSVHGEPPASDADELPDLRVADLDQQIIADERRQLVDQCRRAIERDNPRAARQFEPVWLKYIDGLSDEQIAARLGVSVRNVHSLRHRGLKKLEADPRWRALAVEFDIESDRSAVGNGADALTHRIATAE